MSLSPNAGLMQQALIVMVRRAANYFVATDYNTAGGQPFTVPVPDAVITFSPTATCATTSFSASARGISVHWKWSAAVYTCFPAPNAAFYNSLSVKPTHNGIHL